MSQNLEKNPTQAAPVEASTIDDKSIPSEKILLPPPIETSVTKQVAGLLDSMPGNSVFRYMEKGGWQRWAKKFMDFYGELSQEERDNVAGYLCGANGVTNREFPRVHWLAEVMWDFAQKSKHYDQVSDFVRRVMDFYQLHLEEQTFKSVVVRALLNSSVVPREFKEPYDTRPKAPSPIMAERIHNLKEDAQLEFRLLVKHELPEDIDVMTSMLKKMRKSKMGLPDFPDFLALVKSKFGQHEDWADIEHELMRLKKHHEKWYEHQIL